MPAILIATHGGVGADGAIRVGSRLAERLGVAAHAVIVYEPPSVVDVGALLPYMTIPAEEERVRGALLDAVVEQLRRCQVTNVTPAVRSGFIVWETVTAARAVGADLIVAGLGPHDLTARALGGETALRLAQDASTPVLAVPADAAAIPRRALVAVDFSPTSLRAAHVVAGWLRAGDELHLAHVAPPPAQDRLDALRRDLAISPGVVMSTTELAGSPASALLDDAGRTGADVIALGSHGYGLWKRLLLGSVASKVIRLATTSVLVVPVA